MNDYTEDGNRKAFQFWYAGLLSNEEYQDYRARRREWLDATMPTVDTEAQAIMHEMGWGQ